jgi:hypothetical protein
VTAIAILTLLGCVVGLLLRVNHLHSDRQTIKEERDQAWANVNRYKALLDQPLGSYPFPSPTQLGTPYVLTNIQTPEGDPKPAEDPFLEMADLRRQLAMANAAADEAEAALATENRSNAALRGQITKLTPKKKGK